MWSDSSRFRNAGKDQVVNPDMRPAPRDNAIRGRRPKFMGAAAAAAFDQPRRIFHQGESEISARD